MMPFRVETLSTISMLQAAVLAIMLWVGTHGDGQIRASLRIRALALAVEAAGWGALAFHAYLSQAQLVMGGNALNLIAQAMSVIALRMLLGVSLRWRLVIAIAVVGWLGVAWFGIVQADYRYRVLWGSLTIGMNMLLNVEALTDGFCSFGTRARRVLLAISLLAVALLVWRNSQLWLGSDQPTRINVSEATNTFYVVLSGMQPLFASIGFLLLYSEILQQALYKLARIDALTGISNRLAIDQSIAKMLAHAERQHESLGVLMIDADHFKQINDRYGHAGGDKVLQALVTSIRASLREGDVIGRVGGEEFVVLSPGTDLTAAQALGERVRQMVEHTRLPIDGELLQLTVSVGVAVAVAEEKGNAHVLRRADKALYAAKRDGRNRVMVAFTAEEGSHGASVSA
jgi:diguanylate cyclase (GGDEF)-like protein